MKYTENQILEHTRASMKTLFELDDAQLIPSARLYEDLDIDSIDALDLIISLKPYTSSRISAEDFKAVRTLQDVVEAIMRLNLAPPPSA